MSLSFLQLIPAFSTTIMHNISGDIFHTQTSGKCLDIDYLSVHKKSLSDKF